MRQRTVECLSLVHTQRSLCRPVPSLWLQARPHDLGAEGPCPCSRTIVSLLCTLADCPSVPVTIITPIISPQKSTECHFYTLAWARETRGS